MDTSWVFWYDALEMCCSKKFQQATIFHWISGSKLSSSHSKWTRIFWSRLEHLFYVYLYIFTLDLSQKAEKWYLYIFLNVISRIKSRGDRRGWRSETEGISFSFLSLFGCTTWHVGSYFPNQESNLCPLHWKQRVLITEPRGMSQK